MFQNPPPDAIRSLLQNAKTIAIVGISPRPDRPSHRIARRLLDLGYTVIPVRPATDEVLGRKAYARLADIPDKVDLVDVFRKSSDAGGIIDECIALGLPAVWLQEGVIDEAAAHRAQDAGMSVIMDRCISVEYRKLLG
jgi:predicted CoA-binding protein